MNSENNDIVKSDVEIASDVAPADLKKEMETSYLDYAMSVIVARALPDVRDGLKPVHRRILFSMKENGYDYNKSFKKSARIVGDVMGKYHPHGDSAIYEAMVRMSQNFSMGLTMIDGQGNFGSMDGDKAAAMRYTEARLSKAAHTLLEDLDKDTVSWRPNYDESLQEPQVLPAMYPNLLVNGGGGIAVGMATNIPTHNLGEVLDACMAYIDNPEITAEELIQIVPGPDFPTGGYILGRAGSISAYTTGRGSVMMRGKTHIEEGKTKDSIVIDEIPYQVNKKELIEKIADLVRSKKIEGISDLRDESDRQGVRVVVELKKDIQADVILNQLYSYTQLQTTFPVNMLALDRGMPRMLTLKDVISLFIEFREEVIYRRVSYYLNKSRDRAHILVGLAIAVSNIDEIITMIKTAPNPEEARMRLMDKNWNADDAKELIRLIDDPLSKLELDGTYKLTETQAKAILDLRLHRLTGLERDKIHGELTELAEAIKEYLSILASKEKLYGIMKDEFLKIKTDFATPRKTEIIDAGFDSDIEDLIPREDMVITVTNTGYIKRVPLSIYRAQRRGGKGRTGMDTREEDYVTKVFVENTHTPILFFSSEGMVYKMKVYKLPEGSPTSLGKAMINLLPLDQGETITTVMPLPEDEESWSKLYVMFATSSGTVRRNKLSDFVDVRANGKIAMKLDEGDHLIGVAVCDENQDVLLNTKLGKAIRFSVNDVRVFAGRNSVGVRGIKLGKGDEVISLSIINHVEVTTEVKMAYLKKAKALRRLEGEAEIEGDVLEDEGAADVDISDEEFARLAELEQFILTVSDTGFGKATSSYEYRTTHRGGSGITSIKLGTKNKAVAGAFDVTRSQHVIMITDGGQIIRMPMEDIRLAGRQTMGVTVFRVADGERVVSLTKLDNDEVEEEETSEEALEGETCVYEKTEVVIEETFEEVAEETTEEDLEVN